MKREDIDKRIGMPDVDAEWARFEREVIAKDAKPGLRRLAAWAGGIGIAAAIALLFVLNMGSEESADQPLVAQQTEEQSIVTQPAEEQPLVAQLMEEQPQTSNLRSAEGRLQGKKPQTPQPSNVYDCGEISARFPGGDKALKAFIDSLFVYPDLAVYYGAKGRVIVTFMVDTLGQTSDFKVVRNRFVCDSTLMTSMTSEAKEQLREQLSEQLSAEATRVLSQMPRWTPAEQFGKIVSQKWTVPVIFNGHEEALQRPIAGLTIVPSSTNLGSDHVIRVAGSDSIRRSDSIIVILNGTIQSVSVRNELVVNPHIYFHKQHQMIDSLMIYKDDSKRKRFEATYGFPLPRLGFWEITTIPDTLSEAYMQQHPEKKPFRRRLEGYVQGEDGKPLADAWISCDVWNMGTATDSNGHFVMWAPHTVTQINVQHVGNVRIRRNIQPTDSILNFRMKDATKIKEVRVRGKRE